MKQYEKYKDSGVEWLGEIPEHWTALKFKRLAKIKNGKDQKGVMISDGEFPVLGSGGEFGRASNYLYDKPSVLLGRKGTIDKPQYIEKPFWTVDTLFYTEIFESVSPKFLYYLSQIIPFDYLQESSAVPSMTQEKLHSVFLCRPSLSEQIQIANYIDHQISIINQLITEKESLITKLQEKRKALINEVVTKGLNPNAPMRDSGIEWLGMIPEHWKVTKINRAFNEIGSGTTPTSGSSKYYENGDINWLNTGDLNDGVITETNKRITSAAKKEFSTLKLYPKGSVVIALYGATIGKLGLLEIDTTTNQACCVLSDSKSITQKYLFYYLYSSREHIISLAYGGGQPNISQELIKQLPILQTSNEEQTQIVEFIESRTTKIDATIGEIQLQLQKLKEYKTAVISEVVTGKVDVREWKTPNQT